MPLTAIAVLGGSLWLTACGGGGGGTPPPPPPPAPPPATALPDLDIVAPAQADLGAAVALSTSAVPASALKVQWDFGDGTGATDATPQHQFIRAGDLTVKLTLTNEEGTQKTFSKAISLSNKALVKGNPCSGENDQGWCWMLPQGGGNRLADVQFADASTGWLSDEIGDIYKTTDAGKTWTRQPTGMKAEFPELLARSPLDIVAVNRPSSLAAISDDGGKTWQRQTLPAMGTPYTFIHALGEGKMLIVPNPAAELPTATGQYLDRASGNWQAVPLGTVEQISVSPQGSILTYAGGQLTRRASPLAAPATVFTLPALPAPGSFDSIKLQRTNERVAWIARVYGDFPYKLILYRSVDDGQTWQTITPSIDAVFERSQRLMPTLLVSDASGMKVAMSTATFGPVAETLTDGLWNSSDGGKTWTKTLVGGFNSFTETIYCLPSKLNVFCVRGAVTPQATKTHLSQDFGATFTDYPGGAQAAGAAVRVSTVSGAAATVTDTRLPPNVIPGGRRYGEFADAPSFGSRQVGRRVWNGTLQRTDDGGRTWTELGVLLTGDGKDTVGLAASKTASQTAISISSVVQVDERTTLLVTTDAVVVSRDGGTSWTRPAELNQATMSIAKIQFQDANVGWARGNLRSDYTPQLLTTWDGGRTWQKVNFMPNPEFAGVWLGAEPQLTLIGRDGNVYRSADGGTAWSNPGNASTPLSGFFSDAAGATFWAVGQAGAVIKSADKGATWQKTQLPTSSTLNAVCFADGKYGWAAGDGAELWATQDAGTGWHRQAVPAKPNLYTLACQDSRTAWVGGETGLLATGTGGE